MATHTVDQEARDMATAAKNAINSHELVCAQRWNSTMATMRDIKKQLSWGIGTVFLSMLSLIGWLATRAF